LEFGFWINDANAPLNPKSKIANPKSGEVFMAVEIVGELQGRLDAVVRDALHKALDARSARFVVHIAQPHSELTVHVRQPFDRRLKFSQVSELEVGRELYTALTAIVDEELPSD
jgi:hypothetical protein